MDDVGSSRGGRGGSAGRRQSERPPARGPVAPARGQQQATAGRPQRAAWRPDSLPTPTSALIGRRRELTALCEALLRPDVRLLTLVGPPGIGKTRLSVEVARTLLDRFEDGAFFLQLAPLRDPALVPAAIAQALGVREVGSRPLLDWLKSALRQKRVLLVLDNFEHLVAAGPGVADLLTGCPDVKALVTSRAALRVYGEHEYPVPPLELPDPRRLSPVTALARVPAVALFVERARAVQPAFALTEANAAAVAEICVRLDGLPLAIELAAAQCRTLEPEAMLARLERRLEFPAGGVQNLAGRHQTLRTAVDWSYELLSPEQQRLFRRLAVFLDGFTLDAAEAVCGDEQSEAERPASGVGQPTDAGLLDVLAGLVDHSLLQRVAPLPSDEEAPRFGMLETVREYALARLEADDQAEPVRRRHAAWFLALAERAEPALTGPEQTVWLDRLEREHANLRAALAWLTAHGEGEAALRLAAALWRFWWVHGHLSEGQRALEQALAMATTAPAVVRAKALGAAGNLAWALGDNDRAADLHRRSLALWRSAGDDRGTAGALYDLAKVMSYRGEGRAARAFAEESLALRRKLGDGWGTAVSLNMLGEIAREAGDLAAARAFYEESLALFRAVADQRGMAIATHNLGIVARQQGDNALAIRLHQQCLPLKRELGDREGIVCSLINLAQLALRQGASELAVRLAAAAEAERDAIGAALPPDERAVHAETVAALQAALGDATFAVGWAAGRALTLDEAVDAALALDVPGSD